LFWDQVFSTEGKIYQWPRKQKEKGKEGRRPFWNLMSSGFLRTWNHHKNWIFFMYFHGL